MTQLGAGLSCLSNRKCRNTILIRHAVLEMTLYSGCRMLKVTNDGK